MYFMPQNSSINIHLRIGYNIYLHEWLQADLYDEIVVDVAVCLQLVA